MPISDPQLNRLFRAAASESRECYRGEFAFETRVMARIREDGNGSIATWAWRLAPFFGALAIAAGIWSQSTMAAADSLGSIAVEASRASGSSQLLMFLTGEP